ncbi:host attachment family protein [Pseudooctadecabacter sp.]|uniref:host attachment family protein n=1 Tax=Pseudooctadecabacter sp. TaxID=1966338 RepID=UPI0025F33A38|nr:host attachment family protein [Pseudooctadecabacter sp.]
MTEITNGTHIVIANSEKVLYLVNTTDAEDPYFEVMDKETQDNPSDIEQSANRPGRMADSQGNKSAFQDTDWHELAKERFAEDIADQLYDLAHHGKIDRLVLVAGPKVLGNIREALHKVVQDKIVAEVPKNLAGHPLNEIEDILAAELKAA